MISIRVSESSRNRLYLELKNKKEGMQEAISPISKKEILDAVFSISALDFVKFTHMRARSFRKMLHHVYEWDMVGNESGRLYRIIKANQSAGSISVYYTFNNSKKVVPISSELKTPGKSGKSVRKSTIFKRKADVMESGKPVSFITRKTIVFSDRGRLVFVPKNKKISILNPGGKETKSGFSQHFFSWWSMKPEYVADKSGIFSSLEKSISKSLSVKGAGRAAARNAIRKTTSVYTTVGDVL
jgi:hypothetical protein